MAGVMVATRRSAWSSSSASVRRAKSRVGSLISSSVRVESKETASEGPSSSSLLVPSFLVPSSRVASPFRGMVSVKTKGSMVSESLVERRKSPTAPNPWPTACASLDDARAIVATSSPELVGRGAASDSSSIMRARDRFATSSESRSSEVTSPRADPSHIVESTSSGVVGGEGGDDNGGDGGGDGAAVFFVTSISSWKNDRWSDAPSCLGPPMQASASW